jgi:transcriptional regulator with XRE-family HTH domain
MPNIDEAAKVWELELSGRVGVAVQTRRKALKLTAQQLAERTKALGYPVTRVAISKVEGNTRSGKLDVAELLVLAAALELPPAALLFPDVLGDIEALPGKPTRGLSTFGWLMGAGYQVGLVHDVSYVPDGVHTSDAMRIPLQLLQIEADLAQQRHSLLQSERGPEVLTMPDALRDNTLQQTAVRRERIKILEAERDRLIEAYMNSHGGKEGAEK